MSENININEHYGKKRSRYKTMTVISIVLLAVFVPVLLFNVVLIAQAYMSPEKVPEMFGVTPFIVVSGSMGDTIKVNDLIVTTNINPEKLVANPENGDIVSYKSGDSVVTHRLVGYTTTSDGQPAFIAKGDVNNTPDQTPVTYSMIEGQYRFRIPGLGGLALFLQSPLGLIMSILVPVIIFAVYVLTHSLYKERREEGVSDV